MIVSKIKFKLKNPLKNKYSNLYLDSFINQVKPLSVKSVLVIGEASGVISKLKKAKISSVENIKYDGEKLPFKSTSFDLVICADKLEGGNRKVYKEALRISKKYVQVNWNLNLNSVLRQDNALKSIKVKGVKVISKKLILNKYLVVIRKQV